jgi:hypothetical protein
MKLFDIDWQDFFQRLPVWQRLSVPARLAFAKMQPSQPQPSARFQGEHSLLVESGFMTLERGGKNLRVNKGCWPFAAAIRLMVNDDLLGNPGHEAMHKYVTYQLEVVQREALCKSMGLARWQTREMERLAMSVEWLEKFLTLSETDLKTWERKQEQRHSSPWLSSRVPEAKPAPQRPAVPLAKMKAILRRFMSWPEPVPIAELPARLPELSPETLIGAVAMGVDRLLLFPGLRHEDMTLMLGLWPAITRRLHRPKLAAPAAVQPEQTFDGAFLMEDMTTMLVAASAKPIRLRRNDLAIFAKTAEEIAANLMSVPQWVVLAAKATVHHRVDVARRWLRELKLLRKRSDGEYPYLEPTRRAPGWLAQPAKNRLKTILDDLRPRPSAAGENASSTAPDDDAEDYEEGRYGASYYERSPQTTFLPFRLEVSANFPTIREMAVALAAAFGVVPEGHFWPEDAFLAWRSQEHNPLLKVFSTANRGRLSKAMTIETMEARWANDLTEFLQRRLVPLGGARLGMGRGGICFTLTPAGRYLLELAEDFDYGRDHDAQGQLVVQPNFDIVFLAPSPLAEAALARFAERKGRGVGALFAITKKSIFSAAGSGMTASQVLDGLERLSTKPIPANVAREIAGWFDQCRRITVRSAVLIHCPDAETAARVVAASGKQAVALTDTVVELADARAKNELLRKLHGLGIFTQSQTSSSLHRHGGSRGTRGRGARSW